MKPSGSIRRSLARTADAPHLEDKGDHDQAIADYTEAIRLDPKHALAYINRGNAWRTKEEYDKAIADYDEAIRLDPKDATAYHERGEAWYAKDDLDKAIADYDEAIRLDPGRRAYTIRGDRACSTKGKPTRRSPTSPRPSGSTPRMPRRTTTGATPGMPKGEYDKAIADYTEAIRLDPKDALAYDNRGIAW